MTKYKVTTRSHVVKYIFNTIVRLGETSTYMVENLGIKIADIIKGMIKNGLMKIKGGSGHLLKMVYYKLQEKFRIWCICYK